MQMQNPCAPQPNLDFFKYSPLAGLAMLPFSLLPDAWGTFLFLLFQCFLFLWAFGRWARAAGYDLSRSVAAQWIALASVLLDATASLQNGQWNVGLFALMLLGAAQYAEGKQLRRRWAHLMRPVTRATMGTPVPSMAVHERGQVTLAAVDPVTSISIVGSEQLLRQDTTNLVHRVPHGHLGCLEIDAAARALPGRMRESRRSTSRASSSWTICVRFFGTRSFPNRQRASRDARCKFPR